MYLASLANRVHKGQSEVTRLENVISGKRQSAQPHTLTGVRRQNVNNQVKKQQPQHRNPADT